MEMACGRIDRAIRDLAVAQIGDQVVEGAKKALRESALELLAGGPRRAERAKPSSLGPDRIAERAGDFKPSIMRPPGPGGQMLVPARTPLQPKPIGETRAGRCGPEGFRSRRNQLPQRLVAYRSARDSQGGAQVRRRGLGKAPGRALFRREIRRRCTHSARKVALDPGAFGDFDRGAQCVERTNAGRSHRSFLHGRRIVVPTDFPERLDETVGGLVHVEAQACFHAPPIGDFRVAPLVAQDFDLAGQGLTVGGESRSRFRHSVEEFIDGNLERRGLYETQGVRQVPYGADDARRIAPRDEADAGILTPDRQARPDVSPADRGKIMREPPLLAHPGWGDALPAGMSEEWRLAHDLSSIGGGYVWPRLSIWGEDPRIGLISRSDPAGVVGPIRYLTDALCFIEAASFEVSVDEFLDGVAKSGAGLTSDSQTLAGQIEVLRNERGDAEIADWRRMEARLGFDVDE